MRRTFPPVHLTVWTLAAAAFLGALATDVAYAFTADFLWVDDSDWLLPTGVGLALIALIAGLIELAARRENRPTLGFLLVAVTTLVLGVLDTLVHARDSWTSVMPWGLALSALTVIALVAAYALARPVARVAAPALATEIAR